MDLGVHLPLIDFGDGLLRRTELHAYVATAADLGYSTIAANDHLVWQRPWLDGPTTLTSVLEHAGSMILATTIALVGVRHPVVVAKWLTTLGLLAHGRVVAGLGPGSSAADYQAVGIPFTLEEFSDVCAENPFYRGRTFKDVATIENLLRETAFTLPETGAGREFTITPSAWASRPTSSATAPASSIWRRTTFQVVPPSRTDTNPSKINAMVSFTSRL